MPATEQLPPQSPQPPLSDQTQLRVLDNKVVSATSSSHFGVDAAIEIGTHTSLDGSNSNRPTSDPDHSSKTRVLSPPPMSLYATCTAMIDTLYSFPLFEFYLFPQGEEMYMMPDSPMIEPVVSDLNS